MTRPASDSLRLRGSVPPPPRRLASSSSSSSSLLLLLAAAACSPPSSCLVSAATQAGMTTELQVLYGRASAGDTISLQGGTTFSSGSAGFTPCTAPESFTSSDTMLCIEKSSLTIACDTLFSTTNRCTLDGGGGTSAPASGRLLNIAAGTTNVSLSGLYITKAKSAGLNDGGGLRVYMAGGTGASTQIVVSACEFVANVAGTTNGAAMSVTDSYVALYDSKFTGNAGYKGGGIYVSQTGSQALAVTNCVFSSNAVSCGSACGSASNAGGDIYVSAGSVMLHGSRLLSTDYTSLYNAGTVVNDAVCGSGYVAATGTSAGSTFSAGGAAPTDLSNYLCAVCAQGKYRASGGSECTNCAAGQYLSDNAASSLAHDVSNDCFSCGAGTYSAVAAGSCTTCAMGFYSVNSGSTVCTACGTGTYLADNATSYLEHNEASDCKVCGEGTFNTETGQGVCISCAVGKYITDNGVTAANHLACTICGSGKYAATVGLATCTSCVAGTYLSDNMTGASFHISAAQCLVCGSGKYSYVAAASCINCIAGTFLADDGISASAHESEFKCDVCGPGKYEYTAGASQCTGLCPIGKYLDYGTGMGNSHDSVEDCKACDYGFYQDATGQGACKVCAAGKYAATTQSESCTNCKPGRYNNDDAVDAYNHDSEATCKYCGVGEYATADGSAACSICPAGRYNDYNTISETTEHDSVEDCTECPVGKKNSDTATSAAYHDGSSDCSSCEAGTYAATVGLATCSLCEAGKFNSDVTGDASKHDNQDDCYICDFGKYAASIASSVCQNCPAGRYGPHGATDAGNHDSLDDCLICANGFYQPWTTGVQECAACLAGKYLNPNGASGGSSIGTAADHDSDLKCKLCDGEGQYGIGLGASSCAIAGPGKEVNSFFDGVTDCLPNFYSPGGLSKCLACEPGKSSSSGASSCSAVTCDVGKVYETGSGCTQCSPGKKSNAATQMCDFCSTYYGQYSTTPVSDTCLVAGPGWQPNDAGTDEVQCTFDYYSPGGVMSCMHCSNAKHSLEGAAECNYCPDGKTYGVDSGNLAEYHKCNNCPAGKYINPYADMEESQTFNEQCSFCPQSKFSQAGWSSCQTCVGGTVPISQDMCITPQPSKAPTSRPTKSPTPTTKSPTRAPTVPVTDRPTAAPTMTEFEQVIQNTIEVKSSFPSSVTDDVACDITEQALCEFASSTAGRDVNVAGCEATRCKVNEVVGDGSRRTLGADVSVLKAVVLDLKITYKAWGSEPAVGQDTLANKLEENKDEFDAAFEQAAEDLAPDENIGTPESVGVEMPPIKVYAEGKTMQQVLLEQGKGALAAIVIGILGLVGLVGYVVYTNRKGGGGGGGGGVGRTGLDRAPVNTGRSDSVSETDNPMQRPTQSSVGKGMGEKPNDFL